MIGPVRILVISADNDCLLAVKSDRKNSRRCVAVSDRRFGNRPRFPVIRRMKYACRWSTRDESDRRTAGHQASSTRRKRALTGQSRRHSVLRHFLPMFAILSRQNQEFAIDGIAQRHALWRGTIASQRVQKNFL